MKPCPNCGRSSTPGRPCPWCGIPNTWFNRNAGTVFYASVTVLLLLVVFKLLET